MIRIDQRAPVPQVGQAGGSRRSSGAGFSLPGEETAQSVRAGGVASAAPLDMLLAVQAEEDATERKRRQARRGHDLLDGLDQLKAALLSGRIDIARLQRLKDMLELRREGTDDPRLDEVLAHIELRAAVELAKLGR
jgi:hypothetical protein